MYATDSRSLGVAAHSLQQRFFSGWPQSGPLGHRHFLQRQCLVSVDLIGGQRRCLRYGSIRYLGRLGKPVGNGLGVVVDRTEATGG